MAQINISLKTAALWKRYTVFPVIGIILIMYFDTLNNFWFINMLGGYIIKVWLPPFFIFFFFLLRSFLQGSLNYPSREIHLLNAMIICYVFAGSAALIVHETAWNIGKFGLIMFGPLMLYSSIIYGLRDNKEIERVLKLLFILGVVYSLYSIYLFYVIGPDAWNFSTVERKFMLSDSEGVMSDPYGYTNYFLNEAKGRIVRVAPPGIDEPKFGAMLAPLVLVGFYYALNTRKFLRAFYFSSSLLLIFSVMATLSRSSIAALIAGLIMFFISTKNKLKGLVLGLIVFTLTVIIMISMGGVTERFLQLAGNISFLGKTDIVRNLILEKDIFMTEEGHVASYTEGINIIKNAPLFGILGIGIKNFSNIFNTSFSKPHSRYIFIMDTAGFLTVIPYIGFIVMLIYTLRKKMLKKFKENREYNLGVILYPAAVLFAVKLNNLSVETYYYWIFFALAAAWIRNSAYEEENENSVN